MTKFGWCIDGHHSTCPVTIGGPDGIACTCECHGARVAPEQAFGTRENGDPQATWPTTAANGDGPSQTLIGAI